MKIFFDVDGVLIDGWHSKPERRKPWDLRLKEDLGVDRDAFRAAFFGTPFEGHASAMHACVSGQRGLAELLGPVLVRLGYRGAVDAFIRYWFEKDSNVNVEVLSVVKRLARNPALSLYIATGQEHLRAAYLWNELGFRDSFKDIFYSANLGCLKSTPAFFEKINSALAIAPGEMPLFFDDQEEVVRCARVAGWDAHVFDAIGDLTGHAKICALLNAAG